MTADSDTTTAVSDAPAAKPREGRSRLEEEGNVAADYLETLLDILDLDGDIDIYVENRRAAISVIGDAVSTRRLKRLVGDDGKVLDALQDLTRLAVQAQLGDRSLCMVDVAGHRAGVKAAIAAQAQKAIQEFRKTGESIRMEPMNPFERKVVHDVVAEAGLGSSSDGEEPYRYVVITKSSTDA